MLYSLMAFVSPWKQRAQRYSSSALSRRFFANVRERSTASNAARCTSIPEASGTSFVEGMESSQSIALIRPEFLQRLHAACLRRYVIEHQLFNRLITSVT